MAQNIRGEKVLLRALEPSDIDVLYTWENDTDIWALSDTVAPFSRATLEKYIESSAIDIYEAKQLRLMIESINDSKETIGAIDIFDFDPLNCRAGVGILIGDKGNRKLGYASDALKLLIAYCFETLYLKQIYCNIAEDNESSLALFKKFGFEAIGLKKSWLREKDNWKNEFMLQLINENRL